MVYTRCVDRTPLQDPLVDRSPLQTVQVTLQFWHHLKQSDAKHGKFYADEIVTVSLRWLKAKYLRYTNIACSWFVEFRCAKGVWLSDIIPSYWTLPKYYEKQIEFFSLSLFIVFVSFLFFLFLRSNDILLTCIKRSYL